MVPNSGLLDHRSVLENIDADIWSTLRVSILVICILVATRSNAGILPTVVALNRFCPVNDGSTILLAGAALYYQVLLVCTQAAAGRNLVMLSSNRLCTWYLVVPSTGHQTMVLCYQAGTMMILPAGI